MRKNGRKKKKARKEGAVPLPRVSPATPGLLGTWRWPQLEPCPEASPLSWTRLVTQRWWPESRGLSRGCRVGAAPRRGWDSAPAWRPERSQMRWRL